MSEFITKSKRPTLASFYLLSIFLFVGYLVVFELAPFSGYWNDFVLDSITDLSALFVAVMATAIFLHYEAGESPRLVWKNIMTASWLWFAAEVVWGILDLMYDEVPVPSLADAGWFSGFVFFTLAFYHQYSVIMPARKDVIRNTALGGWSAALLIPGILLLLLKSFSLDTYVDFYYPFADLAVGIAGISLVVIFRGGALMRPWLGLFVFGFSDLLYAWAEKTGAYSWSASNGNMLTMLADSTYILAYLILALGFVGHWALIKYGLRSMPVDA